MRPAERVDVKGRAREHLLRLLLVGQVPIHTDFSTRCPPRQAGARRQQRPDARAEKTGAAASHGNFKIPMFNYVLWERGIDASRGILVISAFFVTLPVSARWLGFVSRCTSTV